MNQTVHLYYEGVPITPAKAVQAVVLPNVSSGVGNGTTALHVFAMTVTTPSTNTLISLRGHANGDYVAADNGGANPLIANRTAIGTWEEFDLIHD